MDDVIAPESPTALSLGANLNVRSMAGHTLEIGSNEKTVSKET